ncbi:protein kinase domain-containing protein [Ditylenchus destructor]|uniref:Protein kinase domain-containing protein n=1 Tax=Ditylenchus destructor TaxID=166010 RepID=A0AAD4QTI7_9BILA|nr:protein kinase domain-containing protein [Ditylenchus destructor]
MAAALIGKIVRGEIREYYIENVIGEGAEGLVFKCSYGSWPLTEECAIKVTLSSDNTIDPIRQEVFNLRRLKSKNPQALVVELLDTGMRTIEGRSYKFMVMKLEKTSLLSALTVYRDNVRQPLKISPSAVAIILHALLEILQSLHRARCLHLDFMLRNILVTRQGRFIAADLARAQFPDGNDAYNLVRKGITAELIATAEMLINTDILWSRETLNWPVYDAILEKYKKAAREIGDNMEDWHKANYEELQEMCEDMLFGEKKYGIITFRNEKERKLLQDRSTSMLAAYHDRMGAIDEAQREAENDDVEAENELKRVYRLDLFDEFEVIIGGKAIISFRQTVLTMSFLS